MKKWIALGLAGCLFVGCGHAGDESATVATSARETAGEVVRWTAIPDADSDKLKLKYDPVSRYLEEKTGMKFEYVPAADYTASVEMFENGDVQMAWFGGLTGVQARSAVPGARAIVQGVEDPAYRSYFIAHASTGLEPSDEFPAEIAELAFTFGSPSSTSGRLMPEFFIREKTGQGPDEFFAQRFAFSGKHDLTARQVAEGTRIKAGVLSYLTYEKMVEDGDIDPAVCKVIWETPPYADYNFTAHPSLDDVHGVGTIDRIQRTLVEMDDSALLAAFMRSRLIEASNEDFRRIEDVARALQMDRRS
ncbi:MAG: putative selenate ABC transporter substrate-binding protein [Deltaproteobacteria bacterium]|jgi:phosphonate transport system substrate-binding protein|nr:putative selenate ABC transporter substrate-binding protein [Deltaproteobacteria bacterium]